MNSLSTLQIPCNEVLVRVTEAGLKLVRLNGSGNAKVRVILAGDVNHDGAVDGTDAQVWEQANASAALAGDLNGDGQVGQTDRQVLFVNYGWRANKAPVTAETLPSVKTHADLAAALKLDSVAMDLEGDTVFWRVLGATHGTARLSGDGKTLLFSPETGYTGQAVVRVQADDGFASGAPIELTVNVSSAKLIAIHLDPLSSLQVGQSVVIKATGDFEDEKNVDLSASGGYLSVNAADISGMGFVGTLPVAVNDAHDQVHAVATGPALLTVQRTDTDGRIVRAVATLNVAEAPEPFDFTETPSEGEEDFGDDHSHDVLVVQPDVYPGTLSLAPNGTRQLKVHVFDEETGVRADVHQANPSATNGTRYISSDESVATISADGLITAHSEGQATIAVVHLGSHVDELGSVVDQAIGQSEIKLSVQAAQITDEDDGTAAPRAVTITKDTGGIVRTQTGETVMIGAGALASDTPVSISRIAVSELEAVTGMSIPSSSVLEAVGAFKLDVGHAVTEHAVQLAIPLQNGITAPAGEEVLFLRKGTVLTADGSFQNTWWAVDNGFIGADGVARTASPPFNGVDASGEYLVVKRLPGVIGGQLDLVGTPGSFFSMGGITFGLMEMSISIDMISIIATSASTGTAADYRMGIPQFVEIELPKVQPGETFQLDASSVLTETPSPFGNVNLSSG